MGWVIGLLALIAIILAVGFGLIFWALDSGLVEVQKDLRVLISRTNGLLEDMNRRQESEAEAKRKEARERDLRY